MIKNVLFRCYYYIDLFSSILFFMFALHIFTTVLHAFLCLPLLNVTQDAIDVFFAVFNRLLRQFEFNYIQKLKSISVFFFVIYLTSNLIQGQFLFVGFFFY